MAKNSIWVTKKQMRNRAIFFILSVVIVLIILAVIFHRTGFTTEAQEEEINITEQELETEAGAEAEELAEKSIKEVFGEEEEPPEAECTMKIKHAEDELLDAYKIQKGAQEKISRLEEQLTKANQELDQASLLVDEAQKNLDSAKECLE